MPPNLLRTIIIVSIIDAIVILASVCRILRGTPPLEAMIPAIVLLSFTGLYLAVTLIRARRP